MNKNILVGGAALVVSAALLGSSPDSEAYTTLFPDRAWPTLPVTIEMDLNQTETSITSPDPDNGRTAVMDKTLRADLPPNAGWNTASQVLAGVGDIWDYTENFNGIVLGDGTPTMAFNDPTGTCTGSCVGVAFTGYFTYVAGSPERIDDADMAFNASTSFTSELEDPSGCGFNEIYVEGVAVHELGHALGLGHNYSQSSATMYNFVFSCDDSVDEIWRDDAFGLDDLY